MPLSEGTTLSHYTILGPLGAGAMGEVYRARDTRLGREVAVKVLPAQLELEPERLQRFEREARTLATLNHPGIAQIYGVDHDQGVYFLALELVPGEDLSARLARGALPMEEAIDVCRQIAAALEAAHEAGVIHRDLKPGNVRVTPGGTVKLLDFGLAKNAPLRAGIEPSAPLQSSGYSLTREGAFLGTPLYMSPEQARGQPVDRRTDIWSFGCMLYECLTGRRAFAGETISDVIGAVLRSEPDLDALPPGTPAQLREVLARCLRKDAATRLRDIGDARVLLSELGGGLAAPLPTSQRPPRAVPADGLRRVWPWILVGFALAALVALALWRAVRPELEPGTPLQVVLAVPEFAGPSEKFAAHPMISPDGRWVAYPGREQLRVRSLERIEDRSVPGSEGADGILWSPGSDALAFSKDARLWVWSLERSESQPVAALPGQAEFNGGVWMPDGAIYFCLYNGDLYAVEATGGTPEKVLERGAGELDFHLPAPLPGGEELIAVAHSLTGEQQVFAFSCREKRRVPVMDMEEVSAAVWSPSGYLLLARNWTTQDIWAVRYSPDAHRVEGEPFQVARGLQNPSVADDGSMVCIQGDREALYDLLLASRDGSLALVPGSPFQGLSQPALSPDGRSIAYSGVIDDNRDIWVLDVERGTSRRLTTDRGNDSVPRWSTDGRTVFFERYYPGSVSVLRVDAEGNSPPVLVAEEASGPAPLPDGSAVLVEMDRDSPGDVGIYRCALESGAQPVPLLQSPFVEDEPAVSPDGRWLAYRCNETGLFEVFLRRLPQADSKRQVSIGGGARPMWGPDGTTLYYLHEGEWMEVALPAGDDPRPGSPRRALAAADFGLVIHRDTEGLIGRGLTPDGLRFLVGRRSPDDPRAGILYFRDFQPAAR